MLAEVEDYLERNHSANITWHMTLNNHASTRPKAMGGKIVPAVSNCKTYAVVQSAEKLCLRMPHSFAAGDNKAFIIECEGESKVEASEKACRQAIARLMLENASQVLLRPKHWTIPIQDVVAGLPHPPGLHQALPVHVRRPLSAEGNALGSTLEPDERDSRAAELVRQCLMAHGGSFDPSRISHRSMGLQDGDDQTYSKFDQLFEPGALRGFIERSSEF
jgi:hypothetical protein